MTARNQNSIEGNEEFVLVTSHRKKTRKRNTAVPDICGEKYSSTPLDIENSLRQLRAAKTDIAGTQFFAATLRQLQKVQDLKECIKQIVCFGLGHFSCCPTARYQLGFICAIQEALSITEAYFHDPIFYRDEIGLLEKLGFNVILENTEGKHCVAGKRTLAYLPHCPKQLTNNFLWKNWSPKSLRNVILINNSFASTIRSQPQRVLEKNAKYILEIAPITEELEIENNFKHQDVFNDTSIHTFNGELLNSREAIFWNLNPQPNYNPDEIELILSERIGKLSC